MELESVVKLFGVVVDTVVDEVVVEMVVVEIVVVEIVVVDTVVVEIVVVEIVVVEVVVVVVVVVVVGGVIQVLCESCEDGELYCDGYKLERSGRISQITDEARGTNSKVILKIYLCLQTLTTPLPPPT